MAVARSGRPRIGRARTGRRAVVAPAVVAALAVLLAGCGDEPSGRGPAASSSAATAPAGPEAPGPPVGAPDPPAAAPAQPAPGPPPAQRLPIGVSENNPWLIDPGPVPEGFAPWRDRTAALHPARYRLFIDWSTLQPDPAVPADLAQPADGCARQGVRPCGPHAGVRERLRAIAARQRADGGGWEVVIVLYGVPPWAARSGYGCERGGTTSRARPITDAGIAGYRRLIRDVLALGKELGVPLRWWSPWNEPNHPGFISPQRARCSPASRSMAPGVYTRIVRAAQAELRADGAPHDLVLGEMAGYGNPLARGTAIDEVVRALPDDVACAGSVWAQHEYAQPDRAQPDAVGALERALDARPCTRGRPIWVTETGVGGARAGSPRGADARRQAAQCSAMAATLERWDADPRVQAVFQFSLREDVAYPVGLYDQGLTRAYPVYELWKTWASTPPSAPPPPRPPSCG